MKGLDFTVPQGQFAAIMGSSGSGKSTLLGLLAGLDTPSAGNVFLNGTAISYDLNGNMLSDGTNAFSWNARNQVATLNGVSTQYDDFGRRSTNAAVVPLRGCKSLRNSKRASQPKRAPTPSPKASSGKARAAQRTPSRRRATRMINEPRVANSIAAAIVSRRSLTKPIANPAHTGTR